jgi:SAM-dependent methyltransferase
MRGFMRSITECPVCSGANFKTLVESTFSGTPLDAAPFFLANRRDVVHGQIQRCRTCGFTFTNPQFLADDYNEIYKNAPRSSDSEVSLREADAQRFRRLAKTVRNDVGKFDRFLDFGCGSGGFLLAMDDPAGVGFELGEAGVFSIGPSQVTTGRLFDVIGTNGFEKGSFDLITSFYVFEHLPDLDKYVEALGSLLKPGGHLVIGVPNISSWNARLSRSRWNNYLLEHLWFFNRKTLQKFMARAGFQETRYRSVAYDAPLAHIVSRIAQTYGLPAPKFGPKLSNIVFPVPIGLMYGVFKLEG